MKTSKENMTGYLERFQMFQRLLQGVAHVNIEMMTMKIDLIILPLDEEGNFIRPNDGDVIIRFFSVASFLDKEENDKVVQEAHKYVKSLKPVA